MEGLEKRLNSSGFADKAPESVVIATRQQLTDMQDKLAAVTSSMDSLVE